MKIASWNVNSLKVRLQQVLDWLEKERPDALCLQELKMEDQAFPRAALAEAGYEAAFSGQKTYNGVAIIAPTPISDVTYGIAGFADEQKRLIAGSVNGVRIISAYFPNGQEVGSEKFAYKLAWLRALTAWLRDEIARYPRLALLGDYNIAPAAADVHPEWSGELLVSPAERAAFAALLELGLSDSFRLFAQEEKAYSWWDYRMMAFRRNFGLRIDHILLSAPLAALCRAASIDKTPRRLERPSDHAPVLAELDLAGA